MLLTLACEILETGGDVDDAGIALRIDQLKNAFEVIFDRERIPPGFFRSGHGAGKVIGAALRSK